MLRAHLLNLIKAKLENMELVVFYKDSYDSEGRWAETYQFSVQEGFEYFLCHPKHKVQILHWLNGGDIAFTHTKGGLGTKECDTVYWMPRSWYMDEVFESYIIPKKEKRWIVVGNSQGARDVYCSRAYLSKEEAMDMYDKLSDVYINNFQIIEIEVGVDL